VGIRCLKPCRSQDLLFPDMSPVAPRAGDRGRTLISTANPHLPFSSPPPSLADAVGKSPCGAGGGGSSFYPAAPRSGRILWWRQCSSRVVGLGRRRQHGDGDDTHCAWAPWWWGLLASALLSRLGRVMLRRCYPDPRWESTGGRRTVVVRLGRHSPVLGRRRRRPGRSSVVAGPI
jgi:hypothetical protein